MCVCGVVVEAGHVAGQWRCVRVGRWAQVDLAKCGGGAGTGGRCEGVNSVCVRGGNVGGEEWAEVGTVWGKCVGRSRRSQQWACTV